MLKSILALSLVTLSSTAMADCSATYEKLKNMKAFQYHVSMGVTMDNTLAKQMGFTKEQQEKFNCAVDMGIAKNGSLRTDLEQAFGKGEKQVNGDYVITVKK